MEEQNHFLSTQEHVFTTDVNRWRILKGLAQQHRHTSTKAENHLWQALRGGQLGLRFRRQHAIGSFIVDFVCLTAWLVVEVDGEVHNEPNQAEYDQNRTIELEKRGFQVIRFPNNEVLTQTETVLQRIREQLNSR
ncbi:endonuclease domain-containing protein [Hymenobacter edaphi]|uniref:ATP-dependent helicase HrpA n=1 Tax=Hymenobacter edaphi TaxID=2211146 RepID=A0A328BSP0_9BACT|nr:endonuclease domain-containing protein [Hymenobacter edaphi]RAK69705.1 ATP-dependent helicase HrpA [Hymenobacter edaphi]